MSHALTDVAKRNILDAFGSWGELEGVTFVETTQAARLSSRLPILLFNSILFPALQRDDLQTWIEPFEQEQLPYSVQVLETEQYRNHLSLPRPYHVMRLPVMHLSFASEQWRGADPPDLELCRVNSREQFQDWLRLFARNYAIPDYGLEVCAGLWEPRIRQRWEFYLASRQGQPIACASTFFAADSAGLYNVATDESHRRQGVGTAIVRFAIADAEQRGLSQMVLTSSPIAEPTYRRLGFRELFALDCIEVGQG